MPTPGGSVRHLRLAEDLDRGGVRPAARRPYQARRPVRPRITAPPSGTGGRCGPACRPRPTKRGRGTADRVGQGTARRWPLAPGRHPGVAAGPCDAAVTPHHDTVRRATASGCRPPGGTDDRVQHGAVAHAPTVATGRPGTPLVADRPAAGGAGRPAGDPHPAAARRPDRTGVPQLDRHRHRARQHGHGDGDVGGLGRCDDDRDGDVGASAGATTTVTATVTATATVTVTKTGTPSPTPSRPRVTPSGGPRTGGGSTAAGAGAPLVASGLLCLVAALALAGRTAVRHRAAPNRRRPS